MSTLLRLLLMLLPWRIRRPLLQAVYGYRLHPTSHIGLAWVFPERLEMHAQARIGHLTVIKGLQFVSLGEHAIVGRLNWISAYPAAATRHFTHLTARRPELIVGEHAAVTHRHIIDCTERVTVGRFATVAGFRSQILTHSIDLALCRQDARPVAIGDYCFVGTACTILGGSALPDFSVLAAHALLNSAQSERYRLYAGSPARAVRTLDSELGYFKRREGFVA